MKIFDVLNIIFLSSIGEKISGGTSLLFLQFGISLFSIGKHCYSLIKENKLIGLMAVIFPSGIASMYIITMGIGFNYFLLAQQESHIINIVERNMQTTQFMYEILILSIIFIVSLCIYCKIKKPKWYEFVLSYSIELITILVFIVFYGGLFITDFQYNVVTVSANNFFIIKLFLYGISSLILKTFATIIAILLSFLLKERRKLIDNAQYYDNDFYEKETLYFLKKEIKLMSAIFYSIYVIEGLLFVWLFLINDKQTDVGIVLFLVNLPFLLMALFATYKVKAVKKSAIFKTLKNQNNKEIFRKFYDEIVMKNYDLQTIGFNEYSILSKTFQIHKKGIFLRTIIIKEN